MVTVSFEPPMHLFLNLTEKNILGHKRLKIRCWKQDHYLAVWMENIYIFCMTKRSLKVWRLELSRDLSFSKDARWWQDLIVKLEEECECCTLCAVSANWWALFIMSPVFSSTRPSLSPRSFSAWLAFRTALLTLSAAECRMLLPVHTNTQSSRIMLGTESEITQLLLFRPPPQKKHQLETLSCNRPGLIIISLTGRSRRIKRRYKSALSSYTTV